MTSLAKRREQRPAVDMRFDSQERIDLWRSAGKFPQIHDTLFNYVISRMNGDVVLDLCGSTGLLSRRFISAGIPAVGIEGEQESVEKGVWGDDQPVKHMWITPDSVWSIADWMKEHKVNTVVARRCISELVPVFSVLGEVFIAGGAKEMFLEGRQRVAKPTHPCPDIEHEIMPFIGEWEGCKPTWRLVHRYKECAHLTPLDKAKTEV